MKKEGINRIIATLILMIIAGLTGYISNQAFENAIKDSNEAYETKISNLESEVKLLKNLNSLYKKQIKDCSDNKIDSNPKSNNVLSFTVDGKPLNIEEVLDYSNNLLNERNLYKSVLDVIKEKYGITFYQKGDEVFIEEIQNGTFKSLEKDNAILKQFVKDLENKKNTKTVNKGNDSVVNR